MKKGVFWSLTISGLILWVLQIASIIFNMTNLLTDLMPEISRPLYYVLYYLGYFLPAILGTILLVVGRIVKKETGKKTGKEKIGLALMTIGFVLAFLQLTSIIGNIGDPATARILKDNLAVHGSMYYFSYYLIHALPCIAGALFIVFGRIIKSAAYEKTVKEKVVSALTTVGVVLCVLQMVPIIDYISNLTARTYAVAHSPLSYLIYLSIGVPGAILIIVGRLVNRGKKQKDA